MGKRFRDPSQRRRAAGRDGREGGFTLIELVLAVGLIGGSFLALMLLRMSAVERAGEFNRQRKVQRVAQEKLEEVVYGLETMLTGTIEGEPTWEWEVEVSSLATTESLYPLLEASLSLTYPGESEEAPGSYRVATRFFADETHPLREHAGLGGDPSTGGR